MTIDLIRQSLQAPNEELKYDGGWGDKYPANGFWRQEENQQQLKEALATIEVINSVDFCVIEQCLQSLQCQEWFIAWVFILRKNLTTDQCFQLLSHPNAPGSLVELTMIFESELINSGAAAASKFVEAAHTHHHKIDDEINKITRRSKEARPSQIIEFKNIEHVLFHSNGLIGLRRLFRNSSTPIKTYPPESLLSDMLTGLEEKCSAEDLKIFLRLATEFQPHHLERMVSSKHWHLRLAAAQSSGTSDELLKKLAKDSSKRVREAASISAQLAARQSAPSKTNHPQAIAPDFDLQLMQKAVPTEQLQEIAQTGSALSVCAATLHSNSTIDVIHAAEHRDLPEWAQLGIARYTDSAKRIDSLLKGASKFIKIALAANPALTKQQALQLLGDDWCNAIIANRFIDDPEVLDSITKPEKWPNILATLRNPDTKAKELQNLFRSWYGYEVVTRLIARHPNCPKVYYRRLAFYCPDDLKQNPTYAFALLASGKSVKPAHYIPDDSGFYDAGGLYGMELAITDATRRHADNEDVIRILCCMALLNPNEVNRLVITNDRPVHNRRMKKVYSDNSEFVYRLIAATGTATQRRELANLFGPFLSDDVLLQLATDKDSSVRQPAHEQANQRGLIQTDAIDKTSLKTLGNKAARMQLAKSSNDPEIQLLLCEDKVQDVRRALAKHQQTLPFACLEKLLTDIDDQVVSSAILILDRLMKSAMPSSRAVLQPAIASLLKKDSIPNALKFKVLAYCDDPEVLEPLLQQRDMQKRFFNDLPESGSHTLVFKAYLEENKYQNLRKRLFLLRTDVIPDEIIELLVSEISDLTSSASDSIDLIQFTSVNSLIYLIKHHPNMLAHCPLLEAIDHANQNSHINFADALKAEPSIQPFRDFQALLRDTKDRRLIQQLIDQAEQADPASTGR